MYDSIDTMWVDALKDCLANPVEDSSRDGDVCGEVIGWMGKLDAANQETLLMNRVRDLKLPFAAAETLWYFSGSSDTRMLQRYFPGYAKYADEYGHTTGAYGPCIMRRANVDDARTPLENVIEGLKRHPMSRRIVLAIWSRYDMEKYVTRDPKDVPCTLEWQFLQRGGKLHMAAVMRSNDAWMGMPYDVFAFTCFQRVVAAELGLEVGHYTHMVVSMHLYSRFKEDAKAAIDSWGSAPVGRNNWRLDDTLASMAAAVEIEKELRLEGPDTRRVLAIQDILGDILGDMGQDLVSTCAMKLYPKAHGLMQFNSEAMNVLKGRHSERDAVDDRGE